MPEQNERTLGVHVDAVAAWIPHDGPISFGIAGALVADLWLAEHWIAIRQAAQDLASATEELTELALQQGTRLDSLVRDRARVTPTGVMPGTEALTSSRLAATAEQLAPALIWDLHPL